MCQVIPNTLSKLFYTHGKFIARHPLPFIVIPIVISLGMAGCMATLQEQNDDGEYLYVPTNAPSLDERKFFEDTFTANDTTHFSSLRLIRVDGFVNIHIQPRTGDSIWNDQAFAEINTLNSMVLAHEIESEGERFTYSALCAQWLGDCEYSEILAIIGNSPIASSDVTFPTYTDSSSGMTYLLTGQLGDVTTDPQMRVTDAGAVILTYYVRYQEPTDQARSDIWIDDVRDMLLDYNNDVDVIETAFWTSNTLDQELAAISEAVLPLFSVAYNAIYVFATLSCMMSDWVRSKPWIAAAGLTATGLGIVSAMGLLALVGQPFASVAGTMPFLLIGIC